MKEEVWKDLDKTQDVFAAPVYAESDAAIRAAALAFGAREGDSGDALDALDALALRCPGASLDGSWFRARRYESVHVGDCPLLDECVPSPRAPPQTRLRCSFVIAARDAEATIADALESASLPA